MRLNKKGFLAISIVYSFLFVFLMLLVLIMSTYVNNRRSLNIYKKNIKKEMAGTYYPLLIKTYTSGEKYVSLDNANWRIIGVFDKTYHGVDSSLIKIVRVGSIGNFYYDCKKRYVGMSKSNNGNNEWSESGLMMMLNPSTYYNSGYRGTALVHNSSFYYYNSNNGYSNGQIIFRNMGSYWNKQSSGCKPNTVSYHTDYSCSAVDFSSLGLSEASRKLIQEVTWFLGGSSSTGLDQSTYHANETGENVFSGHSTLWKGTVGLIYPSDFKGNSWLANYGWTISPSSDASDKVFSVGSGLELTNACTSKAVHPVVYLKPNIKILSGNGSSSSPYKLKL